jgi:hypothetical protein
MVKDRGITIKDLILGIIFSGIIYTLRYYTKQTTLGVFPTITLFAISIIAMHFILQKQYFIAKNISLQILLIILAWTILNPIITSGNFMVVKKAELSSIIIMTLLFIGADIRAARAKHKSLPVVLAPGIIGIILWNALLINLGIQDVLLGTIYKHLLSIFAALIIYWVFLFKKKGAPLSENNKITMGLAAIIIILDLTGITGIIWSYIIKSWITITIFALAIIALIGRGVIKLLDKIGNTIIKKFGKQ